MYAKKYPPTRSDESALSIVNIINKSLIRSFSRSFELIWLTMECVNPRKVLLEVLRELPEADVTPPLNNTEITLKNAISGKYSASPFCVKLSNYVASVADLIRNFVEGSEMEIEIDEFCAKRRSRVLTIDRVF